MKTLLLALLLACGASTQSIGPFANFLTESFGDSSGPCGYGTVAGTPYNLGLYAYSGCNLIWGISALNGGTVAIGGSTGSKQYPIGANSLLVNTASGAGAVTYIQTAGFHPLIGSGTTYDLYMHLRVASLTIPASTSVPILTLSQGIGGGTPIAGFNFFPATGSNDARLICSGLAGGVGATLTKNTDYFLKLHIVAGGAAGTSTCYQASGTQWLGVDPRLITYTSMTTFRAGSQNWIFTTIGDIGIATGYPASYSIGYLLVDAPVAGPGNGPSVMFTPSYGGAALDNISTTAPFAAATVGGNGVWSGTPDPTVGTSTTSLACGTGSKSVVTQSGLNWGAGYPIELYNAGCSMLGSVTSYSGTSLVANIASVTGSGTPASWNLIAHAMSFTAASHIPLTVPVSVYGRVIPTSEATPLGVTYANRLSLPSGSGEYYTPTTLSPVWMAGYWLQTDLSSADISTNNSWGFSGVPSLNVASTNILANQPSGVQQKLCLEVTSGGGSDCVTGPDWGGLVSYTPGTAYFVQYTMPYYHACVPGMACLALGTVTSGTLQIGETITGSISGAVGTVLGVPTGTPPTRSLYMSLVSGTPNASDVWTGGTSGGTYTTTSVPQNFATLKVYDRSCALLGTMMTRNPAQTLSQPLAWVFKIGRSGDAGSLDKYVYADYYLVDYARGNPIPCR